MWRLSPRLREELKKPFGRLFPDARQALQGAGRVVCVGDVACAEALRAGAKPWVMVFDKRVERRPADAAVRAVIENEKVETVCARNEAGTISEEAMHAIAGALSTPTRKAVEVEGEEDLLVIPCVRYAPDGTSVAYGQPGKGIVIVEVSRDSKRRVEAFLEEMKE
jgi:uncharacterized protein (UPF0218 family)